MTAKRAALRDIKDALKREKKEFIPFIQELNLTMANMVRSQIRLQKSMAL